MKYDPSSSRPRPGWHRARRELPAPLPDSHGWPGPRHAECLGDGCARSQHNRARNRLRWPIRRVRQHPWATAAVVLVVGLLLVFIITGRAPEHFWDGFGGAVIGAMVGGIAAAGGGYCWPSLGGWPSSSPRAGRSASRLDWLARRPRVGTSVVSSEPWTSTSAAMLVMSSVPSVSELRKPLRD